VVVTGASSGIGEALAVEWGARGAHVAVVARRPAELEAVAEKVRARGGKALPIVADVADPDAAIAAIQRADAELGGLDMVVANAGLGSTGHASRAKWSDVARLIDVNVRGAMATLAAAIPVMLAQQRGHLVGVTSLAGRRALPQSSAYSASKAAVSTFLEGLRLDLAPAGIKVTDVQPGFVSTPMTAKVDHPMPFLWPSDKAARVIADRLERAPNIVAFPLPLDIATRFGRVLPAWLYRVIIGASR
jgi:NADP-dependent 3-hydroxy acid dehydrogenase YdfG